MPDKTNQHRAGFTMIELIVTIMIIAILVGITLGIAGYANRKAAEGKARADMENIAHALEEYRVENGSYPTSYEGDLNDGGLNGPALRALQTSLTNHVPELNFVDPWGRGYMYEDATKYAYELYSEGPMTSIEEDNLSVGSP